MPDKIDITDTRQAMRNRQLICYSARDVEINYMIEAMTSRGQASVILCQEPHKPHMVRWEALTIVILQVCQSLLAPGIET